MAGRAKSTHDKKHSGDMLPKGGLKCERCDKDQNYITSYRRHLVKVHKVNDSEADKAMEKVREEFVSIIKIHQAYVMY